MDLFYRINMFVIEVPPLRERLSDIPELAQHFLLTGNRCGKPTAQRISQAVLSALCQHSWPGNVRELENVIRRAAVFGREGITLAELPPEIAGRGGRA